MDTPTPASKFAAAYAQAVANYIASDTPQGLHFDVKAQDFRAFPLEPGASPEDVGLYIADDWPSFTGVSSTIGNVTDPNFPEFHRNVVRQDQLRLAILEALQNTSKGKRWADYLIQDATEPGWQT